MGGKNKKPISYDYDLLVIGAGTAGSIAANLAANCHKRVAIAENNKIGGEQIWSTTIPTKWLIDSLRLYKKALKADSLGLDLKVNNLNIEKLQHYLNKSRNLAAGSEIAEFKDENIKTLKGKVKLLDKYHISVDGKVVSSRFILLATGSSPSKKTAEEFKLDNYLTYKELANLKFSGNSFCFIGAGSVAYEYSQILSILGFKVHIIEKNSHVLPKYDSEISDIAEDLLTKQSIKIHSGSHIEDIKQESSKSIIHFVKNQRRYRLVVDNIVVSAGNKPNLSNLGLDSVNIHYTDKGIKINKKMQTSQKNIFAAGAVTGSQYGYEAAYEAQIAIHNMFFRKKITKSSNAIPKIIYGATEIAAVGMTELALRLSGKVYQSAISPMGIISKSHTSNYDVGFVKILANHKGVVVGASVVGENASEVINILSVAIKSKMQACELARTVFSSPSWSEAVKVAASKIYCL